MTNNPMMGMMMPQQVNRDQGGNVNVYGDVTLISSQSFGVGGRQQITQQMLQQQQNQMLLGLAASMVGMRQQQNQNLLEAKRLELEERKLALAEKAMAKGYLLESDVIKPNEPVKVIGSSSDIIKADVSEAETVETTTNFQEIENDIKNEKNDDIDTVVIDYPEKIVEAEVEPPAFSISFNDLFNLSMPYKFKKDLFGNALLVLVKNEFNWKKKLRESFKAQYGSNLYGIPQTIVAKFSEENKIIFIRSLDVVVFNKLVVLNDNNFFNGYGVSDIYDFATTNLKDKLKGVDAFIEIDLYVGSVENLRGYPCPVLTDDFDKLVELRSFFEDKPYLIDSDLVSRTIRKIDV